jgi:hypothetical protein
VDGPARRRLRDGRRRLLRRRHALGVDSQAATAALFGATGAIGIAGLGVSAWLQRSASRDDRGRVAFLAGGGVLISLVFVALILLGGIAALSIEHCRQG